MDSFDITKYREMFAEEAEELFESADNILLEAENNGALNDDEINQLFRDVHTLKGSGASVELSLFAEFTHDVENMMDKLRTKEIEYRPEMAETLIDGLDVMKELLNLEMHENLDKDKFVSMTKESLDDIRSCIANKDNKVDTNTADVVQHNDNEAFNSFNQSSANIDGDAVGFYDSDLNNQMANESYGFFDEDLYAVKVDDVKINSKYDDNFGFFDDNIPLSSLSVLESNYEGQSSEIKTNTTDKNSIKSKNNNKNTPVSTAKVSKKTLNNTPSMKKATSSNTIRVNLDKIDLLMNNVGDLVITNAMLTQFTSTIEDVKTRNSVLERLELLERHIRDMQDSIMSIRMVPMESIYSKFPKVVRDISKKLSKKVDFKHYGDNVEIDKAMIEGLTDPLMHIIRNSLDHGLETPEERLKKGKKEVGSIIMSAEQANGQMIITVEDDGHGINVEQVALKALENGLIDTKQYDSMSDDDKAMLIFGAGISTAAEVTSISGRGVGMDVVNNNIHKLGGEIKLDTKLGVGTTVTIMLPLTLAILDGLDIAVGDQKYILPLSAIVESLQPTSEMIKKIGDGSQDLLMLREEFIPVVRIHQLFGVKPTFDNLEDGMLIVVKSANTKIAISIDEFLNQHQVVVKPLDKNFRSVEGIGAATVRGDGSIGLILDVLGIINAQKKIERNVDVKQKVS